MFIDKKDEVKKVLVLSTGNSCRGPMAEAYLKNFAKGNVQIVSAGTDPQGVHPLTIEVLKEDGIDIPDHTSDNAIRLENTQFDYILTVCDQAKENCPLLSPITVSGNPNNNLRFHYGFINPVCVTATESEQLLAFRNTRDEIRNYCRGFAKVYLNKDFAWEDKVLDFG